jgi:hypothetical protein
LSSGLKALESVGATRFGAHDAPNRRRIIERAPSGACGWSVHLELRGNRMGLGTASDAADRDPGQRDRAGLREGGTAGAGLILVFAGNCGVRSNERDPEARRDPGGGCRRLKPACQRREERTLALLRRSGAISSTQRSRRIATRYDELARNFFSARCFVATLAYW